MNGPSPDYFTGSSTPIHLSNRFPVVRTACGKLGPSTDRWRYVDCLGCLDVAPDDPRIGERKRYLGLPTTAKR